jgi:hypothetical protein
MLLKSPPEPPNPMQQNLKPNTNLSRDIEENLEPEPPELDLAGSVKVQTGSSQLEQRTYVYVKNDKMTYTSWSLSM